MSETNRVFVWLGRVTTMLFLFSVLFSIGFVLYLYYGDRNSNDEVKVAVAVDNKPNDSLKMGALEGVEGTAIQFVRLSSEKDSMSGSPYGYGDNYRNILFINSKEKTSHWLFDKNDYFVDLNIIEKNQEENRCCSKPLLMFYKVIKKDTDSDQKITTKDKQVAALSQLDGSGYQEVIDNSDRIISGKLVEDDSCFAIIFLREGKINYACFDPKTLTKLVEFEVPKVGG